MILVFLVVIAILLSLVFHYKTKYDRHLKKSPRIKQYEREFYQLFDLIKTDMNINIYSYNLEDRVIKQLINGVLVEVDSYELANENKHSYDVPEYKKLVELYQEGSREIKNVSFRSINPENGNIAYFECVIIPVVENDKNVGYVFSVSDQTSLKRDLSEKVQSIDSLRLAMELTSTSRWHYNTFTEVLTLDYRGRGEEQTMTREQVISVIGGEYQDVIIDFVDNAKENENLATRTITLYSPYYEEERLFLIAAKVRIDHETGQRVVYGVLNDITDKDRAKKELEDLQTNLIFALDSTNLSTWIYDRAIDKFTFTHGKSIFSGGDSLYAIFKKTHPDDVPGLQEAFDNIYTKKNKGDKIVLRIQDDTDTYRWYSCSLMPIYAKDGSVKQIAGIRDDITTDMESKIALADAYRQSELILNSSTSSLVYVDTNYVVQWTNIKNLAEFSNGRLYYDIDKEKYVCSDELKNNHESHINKGIRDGEAQFTKITIGNRVYDLWCTPVFEDGVCEGVVIRYDDVTYRDKMIKDLEIAKHRAEESERLKMAFLANMSHEIRTPLNAIVGFSELLVETDDKEESKTFIDLIIKNNNLLLELVGNILDLSKIESGSTHHNPVPFELKECLSSIYHLWVPHCKGKDIEFVEEWDIAQNQVVLDKNLLTQILTNYMSNALKYTPGGKITLGNKFEGDGIKFYVKDTGIGISKENLPLTFERFSKLDDFAQGTGLGLSICKAAAKICGGKIGVESVQGQGSEFWVWMPLNDMKV